MVSMSMVKNHGVPVHLPTASTGIAQDRKLSAAVSITRDGEIFLNKEKITVEALAGELEQLKAEGSDLQVFINGDEKVNFGSAIRVLDEIRKAGIVKVSIQTAPKSAAAGGAA